MLHHLRNNSNAAKSSTSAIAGQASCVSSRSRAFRLLTRQAAMRCLVPALSWRRCCETPGGCEAGSSDTVMERCGLGATRLSRAENELH